MSISGWIGIDPGKTGALARVFEDGRVVVIDVPMREVKAGKKTKLDYDPAEMARLLRRLRGPDDNVSDVIVCVEKVSAGVWGDNDRTQGVTSAFAFGRGLGLWEGVVGTIGHPVLMPIPSVWKRAIMPEGAPKTKAAACPVAARLYPAAIADLYGPRGGALSGRADAILLAHYARTLETR